jgi:hypothetical protein
MKIIAKTMVLICMGLLFSPQAFGQGVLPPQVQAQTHTENKALYPLFQIGEIKTRTTEQAFKQGDIAIFSIGLETIERDYISYSAIRPYLSELGFGRARLMAGWANIEQKKGVYDFSEILYIAKDLRAKGITPWVGLTYGNPEVYGAGAGGATLGSLPPTSLQGRAAWLKFVERLVTVLSKDGLVTEWEIWNEPNENYSVDIFAPFAVETTNAVLKANPKAIINIGAFTSPIYRLDDPKGVPYVEATLKAFKVGVKIDPRQVKVTYHPYYANPDASYNESFRAFRALVESYGYTIRQGENGAPSANQQVLALPNLEWTEEGQAKYALRRIVADFAQNIETGIFSIADMHYPRSTSGDIPPERQYAKNLKGILRTGPYTGIAPHFGDKRVIRPKVAYSALQNLSAILDKTVSVEADAGCEAPPGYKIYGFSRPAIDVTKRIYAVAVWRFTDRPGEDARAESINISCRDLPIGQTSEDDKIFKVNYSNPLTGQVYMVNPDIQHLIRRGERFIYNGVRVSDTPVFIGDTGFVPYN